MRRSLTAVTAAPFLARGDALADRRREVRFGMRRGLDVPLPRLPWSLRTGLSADLRATALCDGAGATLRVAPVLFAGAATRLATAGAGRVFLAGAACAALLCLVCEACFDLRVVGIAVPIYERQTQSSGQEFLNRSSQEKRTRRPGAKGVRKILQLYRVMGLKGESRGWKTMPAGQALGVSTLRPGPKAAGRWGAC